MVDKLKTFASKRNLTILMAIYLTLRFVSAFISFFVFFTVNNGVDSSPYLALMIISCVLGYVSPVLFLISIRNIGSDIAKKWFTISLILGVVLSLFLSYLLPIFMGISFSLQWTSIVENIILTLPVVFIIIDSFRQYKLVNISCILSIVMMAVQFIFFIMNFSNAIRYGFSFYISSLVSTLITILYWFITLLFLVHFWKKKRHCSNNTKDVSSYDVEQRLLALQEQHNKGMISDFEYNKIKEIILNSFVEK